MSALLAEAFRSGDVWLFRTFLAMPLADGPSGEMQIALSRRWEGGPNGEPLELDGDVFGKMIANFNARENQTIPIDIDHRAFNAQNPSSEAAGWITGLSVRDGADGPELWASVNWTADTAKKIKAGAWKFCSPAFSMNWTDPVSGSDVGPNLLTVSLTNLPFQDGLKPIQLHLVKLGEGDSGVVTSMADQQAADVEGSPEDNADDAIMETFLDAVCKASGLDRTSVMTSLSDYADSVGSAMAAKALRDVRPAQEQMMSQQPKGKEPAEKTEKPATGGDEATRLSALEMQRKDEVIQTLSQRLERLEQVESAREIKAKEDAKKMVERHVDSLIATGYVRDAAREDAIHFFSIDWDRAARNYAEQVVPIRRTQAGAPPAQLSNAKTLDPKTAKVEDLEPHEREVYASLLRAGKSHEKAMTVLLSNRQQINDQAKLLRLVH